MMASLSHDDHMIKCSERTWLDASAHQNTALMITP